MHFLLDPGPTNNQPPKKCWWDWNWKSYRWSASSSFLCKACDCINNRFTCLQAASLCVHWKPLRYCSSHLRQSQHDMLSKLGSFPRCTWRGRRSFSFSVSHTSSISAELDLGIVVVVEACVVFLVVDAVIKLCSTCSIISGELGLGRGMRNADGCFQHLKPLYVCSCAVLS